MALEWHASEMDFAEIEKLADEISTFATRYAMKTGDYDMTTKIAVAADWMTWANDQLEERPHRASKTVQSTS